MMYGNNSNGFSYSPDRSRDKVNHYNSRSQFLGASGSRQAGYYYSPSAFYASSKTSASGYYDGAGRYHER